MIGERGVLEVGPVSRSLEGGCQVGFSDEAHTGSILKIVLGWESEDSDGRVIGQTSSYRLCEGHFDRMVEARNSL